jgi:hypothetical protein
MWRVSSGTIPAPEDASSAALDQTTATAATHEVAPLAGLPLETTPTALGAIITGAVPSPAPTPRRKTREADVSGGKRLRYGLRPPLHH